MITPRSKQIATNKALRKRVTSRSELSNVNEDNDF